MKNSARYCATLLAALVVSSIAAAQQAYTSSRTSLRAGPDRGYPQVGWLSPGTSVYVNGCVRGYHWCDVTAGPVRGWANARHLHYPYQNRRVAIYGNGAAYGFPIVGFALGTYWDNHYRGRSWYNDRPYWNNWRPGVPPPPRQPVYVQPQPRPYVQPQPRPYVQQQPYPHQQRPHVVNPPQYRPQPVQPMPVQRPQPRVQERGMGPGTVGPRP